VRVNTAPDRSPIDQDRRQRHHGEVVDSALLITGSYAPELLQPIDESLDLIAFAVDRVVEWSPATLVPFMGNRMTDMTAAQPAPDVTTAIALVTDNTVWAAAA
jgi:hypothetical protein